MAVSPTSQCYRAARRHLRPHCDSIWVPESLLVSAFERYAATFRTGARHGSSVPGPMEHRKRMAKRQMGELHFGQSHSAAPIWELASWVDLTQWKWSPPTSSPAKLRQNMRSAGVVLSPFRLLFPARAEATDDPFELDKILLPENVILSGVAARLPSVSFNADTPPLYVIDVALESLARDRSSDAGSTSLFSRFCDAWKQALAEGFFRGEAVDTILTGVLNGLDAKSDGIHGPRLFDRLKLILIEATIGGMSRGSIDQSQSFDYIAWNGILHGVSTIQMNTIRTFTKAMACVPGPHLSSVSSGILENLDNFFGALGRATERPTAVRQASKMLVPLMGLGQTELRFILDGATQRLLKYAHVDGVEFMHARFGWLLLLARLPGVDREYLARACTALETGIVHPPLPDHEICQLFLAWLHKQFRLRRYSHLLNGLNRKTRHCYFLLGARLWKTRQFYHARSFSKFLDATGRETAVTSLPKGVSNARRGEGPRLLASIALGIRRPRAAIDVLCLFEESRRCKKPFWTSHFGYKALEILTWVPDFDYRKYRSLLKLNPDQKFGLRRQLCRLRRKTPIAVARIAAVSIVIALSPHISRRTAFRLMTNCYVALARHKTHPPRPFLRALVHHVTRPIVDGQPGVTSQMHYVLCIIRQWLGRAEAERVATMMERRRRSNFARIPGRST
ncbi:hypothetical protein F5Y10DRAFT_261577 [Nemania abortiva]|nr:hypothetical protein F5Y10DRAFT_261577 [Nemania abortiva]